MSHFTQSELDAQYALFTAAVEADDQAAAVAALSVWNDMLEGRLTAVAVAPASVSVRPSFSLEDVYIMYGSEVAAQYRSILRPGQRHGARYRRVS